MDMNNLLDNIYHLNYDIAYLLEEINDLQNELYTWNNTHQHSIHISDYKNNVQDIMTHTAYSLKKIKNHLTNKNKILKKHLQIYIGIQDNDDDDFKN